MIDLKALFNTFVSEAHEQAAELERLLLELEGSPHAQELVDAVYRAAHTIKGSAGVVGLTDISGFTHQIEEVLEPVRSRLVEVTPRLVTLLLACTDLIRQMIEHVGGGPPWDRELHADLLRRLVRGSEEAAAPLPESSPLPDSSPRQQEKAAGSEGRRSATVRVEMARLDQLVDAVGEMVIIQSMLCQALQDLAAEGTDASRLEMLAGQLHRVGHGIQEGVMSLRMLPVREVFSRFHRTLRDLCGETGKEAELVVQGEETELDKGVLEKLYDPLVHLVRNALDHGIEPPSERERTGKHRKGCVRFSAAEAGGAVVIEVTDDGRGLDLDRIRERGVERGLLRPGEEVSHEQLAELIFHPGFSTATVVTGISGRGVGMDVVRRNIEELSGTVSIAGTPGVGSRVTIRLPLTLAIIDGLAVRVAEQVFIIPVTTVSESRRPAEGELKKVAGSGEVLRVRGDYLPLWRLHRFAGVVEPPDPRECTAVVVSCKEKTAALLVDEVIGQQPVVLKNLGKGTPRVPGLSGGTIMGDGGVALVLDVAVVLDRLAV